MSQQAGYLFYFLSPCYEMCFFHKCMYICINADSTISRKLVDTLIEFALHIHEYDKCIPSWIWQILCILLGGNRFVLLGGLMIHESFGINWSSDVLRRLQKFKKNSSTYLKVTK